MRIILFLAFCSILFSTSVCQQPVDSVLHKRNQAYQDFKLFQDNMEVRTWINMVNLTDKANKVIEIDNDIISNNLSLEIEKNALLLVQIEKLKLEVILLEKELELKEIILEERQYLYNILIIAVGIISILFLVMLVLFIDRQTRYRNTKSELEKFWRSHDDVSDTGNQQQIQKLNKQIENLGTDNINLKNKMNELQQAIDLKEKELNSEIESKKLVEEEIKKMILQIKRVSK